MESPRAGDVITAKAPDGAIRRFPVTRVVPAILGNMPAVYDLVEDPETPEDADLQF